MENLEVIVHSEILEKVGNPSRLYYLLRAIDSKGSGKVEITKQEILNSLNISDRTFRRWLKKGDNLLFNQVIKNKTITFFYKSLIKVAECLKLTKLGYCGYVLVKDLDKPKILSVELVSQGIQSKLNFIAKKKDLRYPSYIENESSHIPIGASLIQYGKKEYLLPNIGNKFIGFSQNKIAEYNDVSIRTVSYRLANVKKIQTVLPITKEDLDKTKFLDAENGRNEVGRVFERNGRYYKKHTCVYVPTIHLTAKKALKAKLVCNV